MQMASLFDGYREHCCRTSVEDGAARHRHVQLRLGVVLAQAEMGLFLAVSVDADLALEILLQIVEHCQVTGVFVQHPSTRRAQSSPELDLVA